MKTIKSEQILCVDVDSTLVMYERSNKNQRSVIIIDPYDGTKRKLFIHEPHSKLVKDRKARGAHIIVWSQNGYKWAETVVIALKLQKYVDIIASKPIAIVDDLPASDWLSERIYISPNSLYKEL